MSERPDTDAAPPRGTELPDEVHDDWPWPRRTLTFLLGMLIGTVLIAGTHPLPTAVSRPTTPSTSVDCDQVAADSQRLADLADQATDAAHRHDTPRLNDLE